MSEAEQAAFFSRFGSDLEALLLKQYDTIDKKLSRLEFFHNCTKPLMNANVIVELKQDYSPDEIGHFRVLAQIINFHERDPHPNLWVGGQDSYPVWHSGDESMKLFGVRSLVWSHNPDEQIQDTVFGPGLVKVARIEVGGHLYKRGPFASLGDFDQRFLSFYVTKPLLEQIRGVGLQANDYVIAAAPVEHLVPIDSSPPVDWPIMGTSEEAQRPWVQLLLKGEGDEPWNRQRAWDLNYSQYTPVKVINLSTVSFHPLFDGPSPTIQDAS